MIGWVWQLVWSSKVTLCYVKYVQSLDCILCMCSYTIQWCLLCCSPLPLEMLCMLCPSFCVVWLWLFQRDISVFCGSLSARQLFLGYVVVILCFFSFLFCCPLFRCPFLSLLSVPFGCRPSVHLFLLSLAVFFTFIHLTPTHLPPTPPSKM